MTIWPEIREFGDTPSYLSEAIRHLKTIKDKQAYNPHAKALLFSLTSELDWRGEHVDSRHVRSPSPMEIAKGLSVDVVVLARNGYLLSRKTAEALLKSQEVDVSVLSNRTFTQDNFRRLFKRAPSKLNGKEFVYTFAEISYWVEHKKKKRLALVVPLRLKKLALARPRLVLQLA